MTRRFIISYAQNATPIHQGFFESVQSYCRHNDAEFLVVAGRYKNATSVWTAAQESDEWWAPELEPYLVGSWMTQTKTDRKGKETDRRSFVPERKELGRNLTLFSDISIQPTANRPLSGFEVFVGDSHAIFGHPKRALEVVPTGTRQPRAQWTTSACTLPNYTPSKAGKKGHAHHVLGALVVEVEATGVFFCRHVSANDDGSFTDLATTYDAEGAWEAADAVSFTPGDIHAGRQHEPTMEAIARLCGLVKPKYLFGHDVLDFAARNHHKRGLRDAYDGRFDTVESELDVAAGVVRRMSSWGPRLVIVRSNHDTHFERWMDEHDDDKDPVNAPYYHRMWSRAFHKRKDGHWPNLFEIECRRRGVRKVKFLKLNEPFVRGGVAHQFHGHLGPNGSRGSKIAFSRLGCKVNIGHSHTPGIMDGVWQAGHSSDEDHGYNNNPSTWLRAGVLTLADGKRQMVFFIKGRYCADDQGAE